MSDEINPYQAPVVADLVNPEEFFGDAPGFWRKGRLLVMEKHARFPDRCVKSNVPTSRRLTRNLSWHHPAIFLSILAGLLIYVVLALVLRQTARISIGLSDDWFAKRYRAIIVAWIVVLTSFAMIAIGIAGFEQNDFYPLFMTAGIFVFFGGAIYGLIASRMVAPARINATHVWLKGVCPEFLDQLPEWPS